MQNLAEKDIFIPTDSERTTHDTIKLQSTSSSSPTASVTPLTTKPHHTIDTVRIEKVTGYIQDPNATGDERPGLGSPSSECSAADYCASSAHA